MASTTWLIVTLLLGLCASAYAFPHPYNASALPAYRNPGSFIGCLADWDSTANQTNFYMALWDGATGNNYTTHVANNATFLAVHTNVADRVTVATWGPPALPTNSTASLGVFKYGPKQPLQLTASCVLDPAHVRVAAFEMSGTVYGLQGTTLYRIDVAESEAPCTLTAINTVPVAYSEFCSLSIHNNHVVYIATQLLVELWHNGGDNFTVASQFVTGIPTGGSVTLAEDPNSSDLYVQDTMCCYTRSFWHGNRTSSTGVFNWYQLTAWDNNHSPGYFTVDSRQLSEYGAPLFCSTDSFNMAYCFTEDAQTAWHGPRLAPAFPPSGSGGSLAPFYDPFCNDAQDA